MVGSEVTGPGPSLPDGRTLLLVDLSLHVEVDAGNDDVRQDVECARAVEDHRIVEGYPLGDLHHPAGKEVRNPATGQQNSATYRMMMRLVLQTAR
jgi:hypothetical protein